MTQPNRTQLRTDLKHSREAFIHSRMQWQDAETKSEAGANKRSMYAWHTEERHIKHLVFRYKRDLHCPVDDLVSYL